jgi:hypothetical protein
VHYIDYGYDSSIDESSGVYVVKFVWLSKAKSYSCDSIKPAHKNRQDEV